MSPPPNPSRHLRILHIEDDPGVVEMVKVTLGDEMKVDSVTTLVAARRALEEGVYDLVLLDLNLPDSEGPATVEALRPLTPVPIIVLSGLDSSAVLHEAVAVGSDDYLLKPGLTRTRLVNRLLFAHGRYVRRCQYEESEAAKRGAMRRRLDESAFEALKPYITCAGVGGGGPFAAA